MAFPCARSFDRMLHGYLICFRNFFSFSAWTVIESVVCMKLLDDVVDYCKFYDLFKYCVDST